MGLITILEHIVQGKATCRIVSVYYLKEEFCLLYLPLPYNLGIDEDALRSKTFQKTLKVAMV